MFYYALCCIQSHHHSCASLNILFACASQCTRVVPLGINVERERRLPQFNQVYFSVAKNQHITQQFPKYAHSAPFYRMKRISR